MRTKLTELIRTTTARTCLDEAIDRAGRSGNDDVFSRLVDTRLALDVDQADWRPLLEPLRGEQRVSSKGVREPKATRGADAGEAH